jgi:membrane-associated phospholipid phosphatase
VVRVEVRPPDVVPRPRRGAALGAAGGYALVALLGAGVLAGFSPLLRLDGAVSTALYAGDDRSGFVDGLLHVLTSPGYTWFRVAVLAPVAAWLVLRRTWWTAAWVLTAIVLVGPLTALLKEAVGRVRPQFADGGARLDSPSFPSGHSSGVAALVTVALVLAWPRLAAAARRVWLAAGVALVVLVGLTRMWLGVHYLSDVVGGWALGVAWSLTVALAFGALPGGRAALPARAPAGVAR